MLVSVNMAFQQKKQGEVHMFDDTERFFYCNTSFERVKSRPTTTPPPQKQTNKKQNKSKPNLNKQIHFGSELRRNKIIILNQKIQKYNDFVPYTTIDGL